MELNVNEKIVLDLITRREMPATDIKEAMIATDAPEGMVHLILGSLAKKELITIDKGEGYKNISLVGVAEEEQENTEAIAYHPLYSGEQIKSEDSNKKKKKMQKRERKNRQTFEAENGPIINDTLIGEPLTPKDKKRNASKNPSSYQGTIKKGKHQKATPRISACSAAMDLFESSYLKKAKAAFKKGTIKEVKKAFITECGTHNINPSTSNVHWAKMLKEHNVRGDN